MVGKGDLSSINKLLEEYTLEITESIKVIADDVAKDAVKELKGTSPDRKGNYAKSWSKTKRVGKQSVSVVVYNKDHYRLTHLLEHGHATRNGGRTRAFPHIKKVEEMVHQRFVDDVEDTIKNGGKR